jgi:diaminohydroxyphosphoribosylaminopyrimidine deaminase/5-amino-6-(5-phosphoribosylamino)uracil reductase
VVAATEDPYPLVSGRGFDYLEARGVRVEVGLSASRARVLNQPFFTLVRERRPFLILKAATSLDGCVAAAPGHRSTLTGDVANRHAHRVRAEVDAIGVGVGTILVDNPLLTARGAYRDQPLRRVIFDRSLRTPPGARVLSTLDAGPVIIVTTAAAADRAELRTPLESRGAEIAVSGADTFSAALRCLGDRDVASLLLEGGAAVHRAAWDEGVVDYVRLYISPHAIGPRGVKFLGGRPFSTAGLFGARIHPLGPDVLIEGYVHRPR